MRRQIFLSLACIAGIASLLAAQTALTNEDIVKLSKSGLSEEFILNLISQQPANLYTDPGRLVEWKNGGVSERVILAAVRKSPPQEPLTTYGLLQLANAKFSESFLLDLLGSAPAKISTDASNLVQLKSAGVSERVLSAVVAKSGGKEVPKGTAVVVRLIDGIDSEKNKEGETFKASLDEPLTIGGETLAARGADATVKLVQSKESGKLTGRTELTVELVSVSIGGKEVPFNTASVSQASGSQGAKTAKSAAAVGAVGAIIGAIAGGGKGAAIGAGAGAAAGAGSQVFLGGQRVRIPSETVLTFTTEEPVRIL
ncbi:MAG: hypothetical protein ACE141_03860 [Bryobacteraceae bacterium]